LGELFDDLMESLGETAVEAVTIADSAVGLYKGMGALRAASAIEGAEVALGEVAEGSLGAKTILWASLTMQLVKEQVE